jgi:hypothetical protein
MTVLSKPLNLVMMVKVYPFFSLCKAKDNFISDFHFQML